MYVYEVYQPTTCTTQSMVVYSKSHTHRLVLSANNTLGVFWTPYLLHVNGHLLSYAKHTQIPFVDTRFHMQNTRKFHLWTPAFRCKTNANSVCGHPLMQNTCKFVCGHLVSQRILNLDISFSKSWCMLLWLPHGNVPNNSAIFLLQFMFRIALRQKKVWFLVIGWLQNHLNREIRDTCIHRD